VYPAEIPPAHIGTYALPEIGQTPAIGETSPQSNVLASASCVIGRLADHFF